MIEKLKAFGESCKQIMLWLVAPLVTLITAIVYLIIRNKDLQVNNSAVKSELEVNKVKEVMNEKDQASALSLSNYRAARDAYLKSRGEDKS